jgi:hypothetical protein
MALTWRTTVAWMEPLIGGMVYDISPKIASSIERFVMSQAGA